MFPVENQGCFLRENHGIFGGFMVFPYFGVVVCFISNLRFWEETTPMKTLRDFVVEPSQDVGGSDLYFCGTKLLFGATANIK